MNAGDDGAQFVGLTMAGHVVAIEPLISREPDALVADLGPTLQRYLTGPLHPADGEPPTP